MTENKFENTGDFRGAALFQGSTIQNAGQIAGTIRNADQGARDELQACDEGGGDGVAHLGIVLLDLAERLGDGPADSAVGIAEACDEGGGDSVARLGIV